MSRNLPTEAKADVHRPTRSLKAGLLIGVMLASGYANGDDRVADARRVKEAGLRRDFAAAGMSYPPSSVYFRALKRERVLEVWVETSGGRLRKFRDYPIQAMSGELGPKLREGDLQVPEGFYRVDRFNPRSLFLLSLGLDYPNRRDRARKEPKPGYDIFIHGNQVSIGCLAMGDDAIQEIYLIALGSRRRPIPVHIFPGRMDADGWADLRRRGTPELIRFWATLRPAYLKFERTRRVPQVAVRNGEYAVK